MSAAIEMSAGRPRSARIVAAFAIAPGAGVLAIILLLWAIDGFRRLFFLDAVFLIALIVYPSAIILGVPLWFVSRHRVPTRRSWFAASGAAIIVLGAWTACALIGLLPSLLRDMYFLVPLLIVFPLIAGAVGGVAFREIALGRRGVFAPSAGAPN